MKRILVTGGAGFIGAAYIEYLLKKYAGNVNVLCVDKMTYAAKAMPDERFGNNPAYSFSKTDICDSKAIDRLFADFKPEIVVNFAAESHVDRSIADPALFFKTNFEGTTVLLDASRKYGVMRFHQVSTDEVYGTAENFMQFYETARLSPSSPYSASKAAAELACFAYRKTFGLDVTVTRSANNYGRYQFPEKLIPVVICSVLSGKKVPLYGAGESVRDWLYVNDNCAAIDAVIMHGEAGGIYNVAGHNRLTNYQVVVKILQILGVSDDVIEYVPDRPGRDLCYFVNDEKLSSVFCDARSDFDECLKNTVEWYKNNQNWWKALFV